MRGGSWRLGLNDRCIETAELASGERIVAFCPDQKIKCDRHADGDETVGEIECRPVIIRPIDIQKIDDLAMKQAIDEISERAAEDEREGGDHAGLLIA